MTAALVGVGLRGPVDGIGSSHHPRGIFESRAVVDLNNALLRDLESTSLAGTSASATLPGSWSTEPWVAELHAGARTLLGASYPAEPWVCKDPRLCLLLPFWRDVVNDQAAAVLVVRHPVEIARSLEARDAIPIDEGLAMWAYYLRSAVRNAAGMRVLVTAYESAVQDTDRLYDEAPAWLARVGLSIGPVENAPPEVESRSGLDPNLRHQVAGPDDDNLLTPDQRALYEGLLERLGAHDAWHPFGDVLSA